MFICQICGKEYSSKERCYLERKDSKLGKVENLVVCKDCKYGD